MTALLAAPTRPATEAAARTRRTRTTATAVAAAAYVYVLDSTVDGAATWTLINMGSITARSPRKAADQIADLIRIDQSAAPKLLRVRVWIWPGVPAGRAVAAMLANPPAAVRQTIPR